jgi:hypothetical protein
MDGDGYDDTTVGCPYHQKNLGFVGIYSGSAEGVSNTPSRTIEDVGRIGWSAAKAGDPDGSGNIYMIAGEEFGGAYLYADPRRKIELPCCGIVPPCIDQESMPYFCSIYDR